jgi:hypothetical protein
MHSLFVEIENKGIAPPKKKIKFAVSDSEREKNDSIIFAKGIFQ